MTNLLKNKNREIFRNLTEQTAKIILEKETITNENDVVNELGLKKLSEKQEAKRIVEPLLGKIQQYMTDYKTQKNSSEQAQKSSPSSPVKKQETAPNPEKGGSNIKLEKVEEAPAQEEIRNEEPPAVEEKASLSREEKEKICEDVKNFFKSKEVTVDSWNIDSVTTILSFLAQKEYEKATT